MQSLHFPDCLSKQCTDKYYNTFFSLYCYWEIASILKILYWTTMRISKEEWNMIRPLCIICCSVTSVLSNPVQLFATPWTVVHQGPLSMGFPRQEYGVGCHFLLQGIFPPRDWTWVSCIVGRLFTSWATREAHFHLTCVFGTKANDLRKWLQVRVNLIRWWWYRS